MRSTDWNYKPIDPGEEYYKVVCDYVKITKDSLIEFIEEHYFNEEDLKEIMEALNPGISKKEGWEIIER